MESQFERLLKEKIALMNDIRADATLNRGLTHDEYQYNLGYIEALRQVLGAIEEAQSDIRKD